MCQNERRLIRAVGCLIFTIPLAATGQTGFPRVDSADFSAMLSQELAISSNDGHIQKLQTTYEPRLDLKFSNQVRFTAIGRVRGDKEAELGFSGSNNHVDFELREFYLDAEWMGAYWRIGKQQTVWGQADGLRVLDLINPMDYREFILPEFEDNRIPLWTVNVEVPLSDQWMLQLLAIPDQTYDEIPGSDKIFGMTSRLLVPERPKGMPVAIEKTHKPHRTFKDADGGARLSSFIGGWDISLNYLYHYQDQPAIRRKKNQSMVILSPVYERTHLAGASFSNVFDDVTFRSEIAYSSDRYFLVDGSADDDGLVRSAELSYVVGLDYQGWRDWFISGQFFQSIVPDSGLGMVRNRVDSSATLMLQRNFLNESVQAQALFIQNLNNDDGALQVSTEYEWNTNIRLTLGADIFFGSPNGLFGQFKENDRITFGIEFGL